MGTVKSVANMDETMTGGRVVRYVYVEVENPGGLTISHSATVTYGDLTCSEEGSFEPTTETTMTAEDLSSDVEIQTLLISEGDYVNKGTALFQMTSNSADKMMRSYKTSMDKAEEQVESAENKLETTQDSYDNYTITAPISGQVIAKNVKVGEKISRNSGSSDTTLAIIYDLSSLTFEMSIDELDIRNVKVGQKVNIKADAFEDQSFTGTVTNVSLEGSYSNGVTNYPVTVTLDETGGLLPGMNVDGTIVLEEANDVLAIPVDALMRGNRVYVRDSASVEGTQAEGVPAGFRAAVVETGLTNDSYVEIKSGLSEGDEIYINQSSKNSSTSTFMIQSGGMGGFPAEGGAPDGSGNRGSGRQSGSGSGSRQR
ncbi:HlyD family efflux transporter periplasmic adaptor subunit [Clostridium sp. AM58-1XD]|uniref:efflux RND transporter periplasmic adaptor subunit n=1 Tax=Clostridium sp. AM58-1XD TaxID=2292307 RepID=UPI00268D9590